MQMPDSLQNDAALTLLEQMPQGVMVMENNTISWINAAVADLLLATPENLLGLSRDRAAGTRFEVLFDNAERISVVDTDGTYWLRREEIPLTGTTLHAQIFSDITEIVDLEDECDQLADKVGELEIRDEATGLLNRKSILQAVDTQVSRSRRYGNPLSLLRLTLESEIAGDELETAIREISQLLKDQLRWADQIGVLENNAFLIILPETALGDAKELATKLANDRTTLGERKSDWSIRFGAAAWQKGDDPGKLLGRLQVDQELNSVALLS